MNPVAKFILAAAFIGLFAYTLRLWVRGIASEDEARRAGKWDWRE